MCWTRRGIEPAAAGRPAAGGRRGRFGGGGDGHRAPAAPVPRTDGHLVRAAARVLREARRRATSAPRPTRRSRTWCCARSSSRDWCDDRRGRHGTHCLSAFPGYPFVNDWLEGRGAAREFLPWHGDDWAAIAVARDAAPSAAWDPGDITELEQYNRACGNAPGAALAQRAGRPGRALRGDGPAAQSARLAALHPAQGADGARACPRRLAGDGQARHPGVLGRVGRPRLRGIAPVLDALRRRHAARPRRAGVARTGRAGV